MGARSLGEYSPWPRRVAAIAAALVCSVAAGVSLAKAPALLTLTPEHFRDAATLETEPHDGNTLISTQNGFKDYSGPLHMLWHDEYLTALIDKKTGGKSFEVRAEITYSGNWRYYQSASYQAADGSRSAPATQVGKEVADCAVECIYTERIAFSVDEELLRQLAAAYVPGKPALWSFKALAKSGSAHAAGLSNAEIAGLLLKVDEFTHAPTIVAASAAGAPGRLDLGVGGMGVAATEDQPNRAGILIIAVAPGSVAQKSGIIVGDIVFEIDAHVVRQPAELHAAIAACKAGSAVPIKLYRGTEPIALTARF